ncbi:hypothetical protein [Amycolatopsis aidingensis]|uniref:hypothetical protein n=1 Tax=Amycolatopsis aidingensis TaxID=2842453 RepID=UPI001C0B32E5|nr:hypothetical protein [Amycolatopsis aidingensis]
MGLSTVLRRAAVARPRLLLAEAPGATGVRLAVEERARRAGWPMACSAADADVLLEAGVLHGGLRAATDLAARQLPEPSILARIPDMSTVDTALAGLPGRLAMRRQGRAGAGAGEWSEPPMAGRADDRDGLTLDQLRVPLGPALPYWPAGLRLNLGLQGDLVQWAEVEPLGLAVGTRPFWTDAAPLPARRLDSIARLLGVAGWGGPSLRCQVLRDRILAGDTGAEVTLAVDAVLHRVRRSRLLRCALTGLGRTAGFGDAADRLSRWATEAVSGMARPRRLAAEPMPGPSSAEVLELLPGLLAGTELAAARLIVASLDPDLAEEPGASRA